MTHLPQLCLGTVQFGLPYGVTNQGGQVPEEEVRRILDLAASSGIELLDTAHAYGTAETVLGRCWPKDAPRRLISKLAAGVDRQSWEESLITSMERLQAQTLDGFLLHRGSDLLAPDGENLLDWLEGLRERGLVERIGVSIYDGSDLDGLPLNRLQLVQLPLSIYNQRVIEDGTVRKLKDLGISIHVRSIFLQGLLLRSPLEWPECLSSAFRRHHARWLKYLDSMGTTQLAAALEFVRACDGIEAILVGVASEQELRQVLETWNSDTKPSLDFHDKNWAWHSKSDTDPRLWRVKTF